MALLEQPLKKRRLFESSLSEKQTSEQSVPSPPSPQSSLPTASSHDSGPSSPPTPPPLSQEEILKRRRNQEEIRNAWQSYTILKRYATKKDVQFRPEVERAYFSLISASRGCTSVQRLVSDFIPQYASYCPTALEAAVEVTISMGNQSLPLVTRGEDVDGIAFETAKSCILGLIDICCAAASVASTSAVIHGICCAVFVNVLTFFASSSETKDTVEIVDKETMDMLDSAELFGKLKQRVSAEAISPEMRLSKLRALSFFRIFFCCPIFFLGACFELFDTTLPEEFSKEGNYIWTLLSSTTCDDGAAVTSMDVDPNENDIDCVRGDVSKSDSTVGNCLLAFVVHKNPSLRSWILTRYKRLCKSAASQAISVVTAVLQGTFHNFSELVKRHDGRVEIDYDSLNSVRLADKQYLGDNNSNRLMSSSPVSGKCFTLKGHDGSYVDDHMSKPSGSSLLCHSSMVSQESDHHSNTSSNLESGGSKSMGFESKEHADTYGRSPIPRDHINDRLLSPLSRKPGVKTDVSEFRPIGSPYPHTSTPIEWVSDGDPAAMEIFTASKQLWLGSLAPDVSEASVRFQLERFGPIESFSFFPFTGFALVEYRSIIDAVKAREYMGGRSPWGSQLRIKFMDTGLGTRGAMNGVAVGSSCLVYVGNVSSQWIKDEVLHETRKVVFRGPRWITDLISEAALLMEFETPDEAAGAMAFLRQHRKGRTNSTHALSCGPSDIPRSHFCHASSMPPPACSASGNVPAFELRSPTVYGFQESHSGKHWPPPPVNPDYGSTEFASPRAHYEKHGLNMQTGHASQLNWSIPGSAALPEFGPTNYDVYGRSASAAVPQGGTSEQMWTYRKAELESPSAPMMTACLPQGPAMAPQLQTQAHAYAQPVYPPPNYSWDACGLNPHPGMSHMPPGFIPNSIHGSAAIPSPFMPASVTPLSQFQGNGVQQYGQIASQPVLPPPLSSVAPHEVPLNLPLSKSEVPPLPPSPPAVPPPPSSPPPPPPPDAEPAKSENPIVNLLVQWQGSLSKSGVHYCTINAHRMDSDSCKYTNSLSEPAEWPSKLDMTKRTDFKHVKSTFASTPSHRREVCQLLPSSPGDHTRFQDFISYLKQKECAGVIKISARKPMWTRLLFILPYVPEMCTMLSVTPSSSDCLIALILPKETNSEGS